MTNENKPAIFQDVFDTWEAATAYQRIGLQYFIEKGLAIRACEIRDEINFVTGKRVYAVFVRPFIVSDK